MKKSVEVTLHDLKKIGNTMLKDSVGNLAIICSISTANIEEILLRNILEISGNKILSEEDFVWENDEIDIQFVTDFKWSDYQDLDNFIKKLKRNKKIDKLK